MLYIVSEVSVMISILTGVWHGRPLIWDPSSVQGLGMNGLRCLQIDDASFKNALQSLTSLPKKLENTLSTHQNAVGRGGQLAGRGVGRLG